MQLLPTLAKFSMAGEMSTLTAMSDLMMGKSIGKLVQDRQALLGLLGILNDPKGFDTMRKNIRESQGGADLDQATLMDTASMKNQLGENAMLNRQFDALQGFGGAIGDAKVKLSELSTEYPAAAAGLEAVKLGAYAAGAALMAMSAVMGIRRRRCAAVMAMQRGFDKSSADSPPRVRAAVEKWFRSIDVQQLVRELIDGAFYGFRVGEVMWAMIDGLPSPKLVTKPGEWFGFEGNNSELHFKAGGNGKGVAVDPLKFIVVGKLRSWENPYGEPDLAACFWPVTFKRGGMNFWVTFTEKYGSPWAVGKLPRSASKVETDDLADKLAGMVRDAVAVIPDDASVELIQAAGTANAEMYEKLLMFCRSEISIALLGNNQSVEMQSNQASATAARVIEADLRDDDAAMVADGINQLVRRFCAVNFEGERAPVYRFWAQAKVDVLQASRDEKLQAAGARFSNEYFERVYNLRPGDLAAGRVEPPLKRKTLNAIR